MSTCQKELTCRCWLIRIFLLIFLVQEPMARSWFVELLSRSCLRHPHSIIIVLFIWKIENKNEALFDTITQFENYWYVAINRRVVQDSKNWTWMHETNDLKHYYSIYSYWTKKSWSKYRSPLIILWQFLLAAPQPQSLSEMLQISTCCRFSSGTTKIIWLLARSWWSSFYRLLELLRPRPRLESLRPRPRPLRRESSRDDRRSLPRRGRRESSLVLFVLLLSSVREYSTRNSLPLYSLSFKSSTASSASRSLPKSTNAMMRSPPVPRPPGKFLMFTLVILP